MLLALDIGNTQTMIGLYDADRLCAHQRFPTDKHETVEHAAQRLISFLEDSPCNGGSCGTDDREADSPVVGGAGGATDSDGGVGGATDSDGGTGMSAVGDSHLVVKGPASDARVADDTAENDLSADSGVIASVVPSLTTVWGQAVSRITDAVPLIVNASVDIGLPIHYDNPAEIGADRLVDAVAAIASFGAPVVVVDFGTATNIEVVDREGAFVGGIIAPGLDVSAQALFSIAAKLSAVPLEIPPCAIGRSTSEAVQAGLTFGEMERVDGLVDRVIAELGYPVTVVATGGLAPRIIELSRHITVYDEFLTLKGLRLVYEHVTAR